MSEYHYPRLIAGIPLRGHIKLITEPTSRTVYNRYTGKSEGTEYYNLHFWEFNGKRYLKSWDSYDSLVKAIVKHFGAPFIPSGNDERIEHGFVGFHIGSSGKYAETIETDPSEVVDVLAKARVSLGQDAKIYAFVYVCE